MDVSQGWTIPKAAYELPGSVRVREEDKRQILFIRGLRKLALGGAPLAWFHVANELELKGPAGIAVAKRRRMMGTVPGCADVPVYIHGRPAHFEFKSDTGRASENQKDFAAWIERQGIPTFFVRSHTEALDIVCRLLLDWQRTTSPEKQTNDQGTGKPAGQAEAGRGPRLL